MRKSFLFAVRVAFLGGLLGFLPGLATLESYGQSKPLQNGGIDNGVAGPGATVAQGAPGIASDGYCEARGDGLPAVPAQNGTVIDHRMSGGPVSSNCFTPVARFNFAPTDARAYQWTSFTGVRSGDVVGWSFIKPDGAVYASTEYKFGINGNGCAWAFIGIADYPAALLPGNWQVRVFYNGEQILAENFTIAGTAIIDHKMSGGPIPNGCISPAAKFNFVPTDARAYQWTYFSGANVGDAVKLDYIKPDGTPYGSDQRILDRGGDVCVWSWIDIAGAPAASLPGSWQMRFFYNGEQILAENFTITVNPVVSVSAASFAPEIAVESIVAAFGSSLAPATAQATTPPLPTSLAGVTLKVRDSSGAENPAPLFFVSPGQINFQVPPGTTPGAATMTVVRDNQTIAIGATQIAAVAPALFTANANGQGVPAAVALRVRGDGSQSFEQLIRLDPAQGRFVPVPIDLGPENDQVFLILFGTGFRNRSSLAAVSLIAGGLPTPVLYAGPQGALIGLDQINWRLPRGLAGRGLLDLIVTADGKTANTVQVIVK